MVAEMVQVAWTQYVRGTNLDRLGPQAELRNFLFGTERTDLSSYRRRYPMDLGHNFVLADRRCNAAKADRLTATPTSSGGASGTAMRSTSCRAASTTNA